MCLMHSSTPRGCLLLEGVRFIRTDELSYPVITSTPCLASPERKTVDRYGLHSRSSDDSAVMYLVAVVVLCVRLLLITLTRTEERGLIDVDQIVWHSLLLFLTRER